MSEEIFTGGLNAATATVVMGMRCTQIVVVNPEGKDHLEDLGVDGGIILRIILCGFCITIVLPLLLVTVSGQQVICFGLTTVACLMPLRLSSLLLLLLQ
jgi:hypothetical protein